MKWLWRFILGLLLLSGLTLGAITWLASREESLQWLLQRAIKNTPLKLELQGLHGSLWKGVRIERLRLEHPEWRLDLRDLTMRWFYWPPDHVQIPRLRIAELQFEQLYRSDTALKLPGDLGLPFDLNISTFEINRMLVIILENGNKTNQEMSRLEGSLSLGKQSHHLYLHQLFWAGMKIQVRGKMSALAPFSSTVSLQVDSDSLVLAGVRLPWQKLLFDITGDLSALKVNARWQSLDSRAPAVPQIVASTILRPLTQEWLQPTQFQVRDLSWSSLVQDQRSSWAEWQALVDAEALLSLAQGRVQIDLKIINKIPGKVANKKIPLKSMLTRIQQVHSGWQVSDLQLLDWAGQKITGSVQWLKTAQQQKIDAQLHFSGLQAQATWLLQPTITAGWQFKVEAKHWNPASLNASLLKQGWSTLPVGNLNGSFKMFHSSSGMPFEFMLRDSRLGQIPVVGQARGVISRLEPRNSIWEVTQVEFLLRLAEAKFQGSGSWGTLSSQLSLAMSAPNLQRIANLWGESASGRAEVHAVVGGGWDTPLITASLSATHLSWAGEKAFPTQVERLNGYIQIVDRQVEADFNGERIKLGNLLLNEGGLRARGGLQQHVLNLYAQGGGANRPVQLSAELTGGWLVSKEQGLWRGQWRRFDNEGQYRTRLLGPVPVEISAKSFSMKNAIFEVAGGQLQIDEITYAGGQWQSSGNFQQLSGQVLSYWVPGLATARNTLTLGGRWEFIKGDHLTGELHLLRQQGDVWLAQFSHQSMGIERLGVHLSVKNNLLEGSFDLLAQRAGQLHARVKTLLSERDHTFTLTGDAPVNATVKGQLTTLAWLGLLTDVPFSAEGNISVEAKVTGTLKNPQLEGFLNGDRLVLHSYQPRATLRDGKVRLALQSGIIYLREFSFSGRNGRLNAEGSIDPRLRGEQGKIQVKFDKLDTLIDPLYRLILSGQLQIDVRDLQGNGSVFVAGKLRADQARLTLKDVTAPTLSEDVVILNGDTELSLAQRRFPVDVELDFDFGTDFEVTGYGAEAQLQGNIALQARTGHALRAIGTVRTVSGQYFAYGQQLAIERGSLSFSGALDNPGLNFYAVRPNLPVQVGVEVTGTLTNPRAKLVSRPEMSNTEKISWLALGRGIDSASRNDLQLLSLAASTLLDRGEGLPLNQRVAKNIGLDDIGFRGAGGLEETVVTLGKRLSNRLYLTLERSLSGTSTLAKLRYEVARRWYLQAMAGTEESALDIFFTLSFD